MANLYKKPVVSTDLQTGQKTKGKSKKWWGQYKDADGRLRRHPLSTDKKAAQQMLNEIVLRIERQKAGLIDPTEEQRQRPLAEHLQEFKAYLINKGVGERQYEAKTRQIEKIVEGCRWLRIDDITATSALEYLGDLRREGRSAQTYNHYLIAIKQFTRWLERDRRMQSNPLLHLAKLNVKVDRRHDRRALSAEEFTRLLDAAQAGGSIEGISGPDRAMLYKLAAWTGFRKGEIGSLTPQSLKLDRDPPTATVAACYSKHRREDTQVLHSELARQLGQWLQAKQLPPTELLFPISGRAPKGIERKTNKMIQLDLQAARTRWLATAATAEERRKREQSDFLTYCNHAGLYADFHSCRHLFITSLERAGVRPKVAQTLARHSDIRLTLNVYTHAELADQQAAIAALPGPPTGTCHVRSGSNFGT